ncbi:MAG: hypothetical protein U0359_08335 [Byssovorax sp.]
MLRKALLVAALGLLPASSAWAQGSPAPAPPAPAPARPERAAIARVAADLVRDLGATPARVLVAGGPLTTDIPSPRAAQLVALVASQIAGRRGGGAHVRPEPSTLAAARAAAAGDSALVYIAVEIAQGKLRVTADVYPVPRSVWARVRDPEPGPVAHAFAQAPIDAEVRSFLDPIPIVAAHVDRARNFEGDVVALACGDLAQDGGLQIVAVSRRRVTALRLREGRVIPLVSRNWPDLSPVAPAPLREPIGFATMLDPGIVPLPKGAPLPAELPAFVDVGITDRARSVRLDGALQIASSFPGVAVPDGEISACTRLSALTITGAIGPCAPGDLPPHGTTIGGQYDAFASARLVTARGQPFTVWAGRERGVLEVRDDAGRKLAVEVTGAQLAVGDLDQDGEPEILSSLDTQNPMEDAVVVRSWARTANVPAAARFKEILRIPAAAGVRALAVCPPDGPGRAPFAVATADEIWVVR